MHHVISSTQVSATARPRTSMPLASFAVYQLMMMPVHDQPCRRGLGQPIDVGEAVAMA